MKTFQPIMIPLTYYINVPGSAGGAIREGEAGVIYLGSDGYYYIINGDGTIDQLIAPDPTSVILNMTEAEFNALGVTLGEYMPDM